MPRLSDLKETALYVDNLDRAKQFYREVLGLQTLVDDEGRFCALDVVGKHVLLLFLRGASTEFAHFPGGSIPPHDGNGPIHAAFSVDKEELPKWEAHLASHGVEIISRMTWPRGGQSVYFRDPDNHVLELLTPGVWATY